MPWDCLKRLLFWSLQVCSHCHPRFTLVTLKFTSIASVSGWTQPINAFGPRNALRVSNGWMDYEMKDAPEKNDYEMYEEFVANYGSSSLLPFLQGHFKPCSPGSVTAADCRPFYMPCKSELACAVSCRVNDYSCGKCSETNSYRKVCQCCDYSGGVELASKRKRK